MHHIDVDKHAVYVLFLVLSTGNNRGLSESYNCVRGSQDQKIRKINQKIYSAWVTLGESLTYSELWSKRKAAF